ncbi:MAG TPA: hypothetical protein VHT02_08805, partial [Methylocella sp.]|nr:hypothetical protein [Methylocella sp.]
MTKLRNRILCSLPIVLLAWTLPPAPAQARFVQQGNKLVGTGAVGGATQGQSVAISGDGNTALVGGPGDNGSFGAAWVFTLSGGVWNQQGPKLIGSGSASQPQHGFSVALSGDGNTALVGAPSDNSGAGAAWVFTRSGGVWSQQAKLVGTGGISPLVYQGASVSLSGDGNTAIVGAPSDDNFIGAAWVYTRSGETWSQQAKLVGTGAIGLAEQGASVSLSSHGNIAIVGGPDDNGGGSL